MAKLAIGHGHLEGGAHHAVHRRSSPKSWATSRPAGHLTSRARLASIRRRTPRSTTARATSSAVGSTAVPSPRAAHSPQPSPSVGLDPHEEQGPGPVHAGRRADVVAERDLGLDELNADELHRCVVTRAPLTPSP